MRVINASGVAGRARTALNTLVKRGYQDAGVETASVQMQTMVYISIDLQANSADIQNDILTMASISGVVRTLEGKSHTVKIILGTQ